MRSAFGVEHTVSKGAIGGFLRSLGRRGARKAGTAEQAFKHGMSSSSKDPKSGLHGMLNRKSKSYRSGFNSESERWKGLGNMVRTQSAKVADKESRKIT